MKKQVESILNLLEGKTISEMYLFLRDKMVFDKDNIKKFIKLKTDIDIITFDDIVFDTHPIGKGNASSGEVNGKKYSIISGSMFYSDGEGINYEIYNSDMDEPDGYMDEEGVTLSLLNLYKD